MNGAKGPNSSQYDFKGTSVHSLLLSINLPQVHTSRPHLVQEAQVDLEPLVDLNLTKAEASQTNSLIKPTNSKALNTELPWLLRVPTLKKISKNSKKKLTSSLKSVSILSLQVCFYSLRSKPGRIGEGQIGDKP